MQCLTHTHHITTWLPPLVQSTGYLICTFPSALHLHCVLVGSCSGGYRVHHPPPAALRRPPHLELTGKLIADNLGHICCSACHVQVCGVWTPPSQWVGALCRDSLLQLLSLTNVNWPTWCCFIAQWNLSIKDTLNKDTSLMRTLSAVPTT